MIGQMFKDITRERLIELSERILKRPLKPYEYNRFLHDYGDRLDNIYIDTRQRVDKHIMEYVHKLKEKDKQK